MTLLHTNAPCNGWCYDDVHASVLYAQAGMTVQSMQQQLWPLRREAEIVHVRWAAEASLRRGWQTAWVVYARPTELGRRIAQYYWESKRQHERAD